MPPLKKRNQIIRSVAEIFTDIDSLITSFRTDLLPEDKFAILSIPNWMLQTKSTNLTCIFLIYTS